MTKWVLLIFGLILLVSGAWCWYWLSQHVQPSDAKLAFQHLVEIPDTQLTGGVSVDVSAPQGSEWGRIRKNWGEPEYEIAVIADSKSAAYQHCLDRTNVRANMGAEPVRLEPAGWLYSYSSAPDSLRCDSIGLKFRMAAGQIVNLYFVADAGHVVPATQMVIAPIWPYTKDKLVGLSIEKDLRSVVKFSMVIGLFATVFAGFLFTRSKRPTSTRVNVSS